MHTSAHLHGTYGIAGLARAHQEMVVREHVFRRTGEGCSSQAKHWKLAEKKKAYSWMLDGLWQVKFTKFTTFAFTLVQTSLESLTSPFCTLFIVLQVIKKGLILWALTKYPQPLSEACCLELSCGRHSACYFSPVSSNLPVFHCYKPGEGTRMTCKAGKQCVMKSASVG